MSIEIAQTTSAGVEAVAAVAGRTFALACPPDAAPEDIAAFVAEHLTAERFREYVADPARRVVQATIAGSVVGYAMLVLGPPPPDIATQLTHAPTAELSKIYVDPGHHGGEIARALLAEIVAIARAERRAGVWLGTNQANARAQRFYEKSGFARVGDKRFRVGDALHHDFVYELALA